MYSVSTQLQPFATASQQLPTVCTYVRTYACTNVFKGVPSPMYVFPPKIQIIATVMSYNSNIG